MIMVAEPQWFPSSVAHVQGLPLARIQMGASVV
jgi:hypothetical protein